MTTPPVNVKVLEKPRAVRGDEIVMVWECPKCGRETVAYRSENATVEEIQADASCVVCRKKGEQ